MKYSENLVSATMKALENLPFNTVWNIHKRTQFENFCEIRFENVDGSQMSINISKSTISAIVYTDANGGYKWFGDCHMKQVTKDTYMMWLGIVTKDMIKFLESETYALK